MKIYKILFLLGLLCVTSISHSQVTLLLPDIYIESEENITIDVKVAGFDSIQNIQFAIKWDSTILTFQEVNNYGIPDVSFSDNFGFTSDTLLTFSWYKFNGSEPALVSLEDNSTIFSINFGVSYHPNVVTQIEFTNLNITSPIEINDNHGTLEVSLVNGSVSIDTLSPISEINSTVFKDLTNSPNPFIENTNIYIKSDKITDMELVIFSDIGTIVYKNNYHLNKGNNIISITKEMLPLGGTYFCKLSDDISVFTGKIVLLK